MEYLQSSSVRVPGGGDKVFKDECIYCFDSPVRKDLRVKLYESLTADNIFSSDMSNRRVMEGFTFALLLFLAFVKNMFVCISVRHLTEFSCI